MEPNEICQFVLTGYFSTAVLWFFALINLIYWHPREYNQQTQKIELSNCRVVTWQHHTAAVWALDSRFLFQRH